MLKPSRVAVAVGLTVLLTGLGCSHDPLAGRRSLDLEQALHGHWSSHRELDLGPGAAMWDTTGATERWHAEIDLYIDAQSEPKVWAGIGGDRHWQTRSQDSAAGMIEIETWPVDRSEKTTALELHLDGDRTTILEKLPSTKGQKGLREWNYINDQGIHP